MQPARPTTGNPKYLYDRVVLCIDIEALAETVMENSLRGPEVSIWSRSRIRSAQTPGRPISAT